MKRVLCVDWDDTIYDRKTRALMPGAKEGLSALREQGWNLIVYSANNTEWILRMIDEHDLHPLGVWIGDGKPNATCFLDDRAVRFTGWSTAPDEIAALHQRSDDDGSEV